MSLLNQPADMWLQCGSKGRLMAESGGKKKVEITLRFGFELQKSIEEICSRNVVPFLNSLREQ